MQSGAGAHGKRGASVCRLFFLECARGRVPKPKDKAAERHDSYVRDGRRMAETVIDWLGHDSPVGKADASYNSMIPEVDITGVRT